MSFQILLQSQTADGGWICQTPESMRTLTPALPAENRLVLRSARLHPALTLCGPVRLYKTAYMRLPESLPSLSWLGGEGGLWVSHFPAYLRPWGRNPARLPWSAQQQSRQVPRVAETVGEFWRYRSPDKSFLQSGSRRADCDLGRVTAQLQPQHKLPLVTALILQHRQENVRTCLALKFSIHSFVHSFLEYSANP